MRIYLEVRCGNPKCKEFYNVRYTDDRELLAFRLDLSICSHCGWVRNKKMHTTYLTDWHCKGCNIAGMILQQSLRVNYRKIGKYCNQCYMADWYDRKNGKRFKREVAVERNIVVLG